MKKPRFESEWSAVWLWEENTLHHIDFKCSAALDPQVTQSPYHWAVKSVWRLRRDQSTIGPWNSLISLAWSSGIPYSPLNRSNMMDWLICFWAEAGCISLLKCFTLGPPCHDHEVTIFVSNCRWSLCLIGILFRRFWLLPYQRLRFTGRTVQYSRMIRMQIGYTNLSTGDQTGPLSSMPIIAHRVTLSLACATNVHGILQKWDINRVRCLVGQSISDTFSKQYPIHNDLTLEALLCSNLITHSQLHSVTRTRVNFSSTNEPFFFKWKTFFSRASQIWSCYLFSEKKKIIVEFELFMSHRLNTNKFPRKYHQNQMKWALKDSCLLNATVKSCFRSRHPNSQHWPWWLDGLLLPFTTS